MNTIRVQVVLAGVGVLWSRLAFASNPAGGCTEETFGAACDYDGTNPCSGVCLTDASQEGVPIACLPADATALTELGMTSLDGAACSLAGNAASDCTHSCEGGVCVATNAASGAKCQPVDGGANVCSGACNGSGSCLLVPHGGEKYGRGEWASGCTFLACQPLGAESPNDFPAPLGMACTEGDPCTTGNTCVAVDDGKLVECGGGTPVAGCVVDDIDSGVGDGGEEDAASRDDGSVKTRTGEAGTTTEASDRLNDTSTSGGSGCAVDGRGQGGLWGGLVGLLFVASTGLRRRRPGR
jgi:hypothetical protein